MNRSRVWRIGIMVLFLGARESATAGQQQPTSAVSQTASDAATAYDGKDWAKSAKLYAQIVQTAPNPRAWYRLGVSLNKIGENDKAIEAFENLEKAAQNGLSQPDQLSADPDLADLRSDARFAKILEEVTRNQKPCANTTENRQFDFWLGEWRVVTTQGETPAGDSKIELILGDCVIQENWTSGGNVGYSGKSYNIYNAALKRWEQYWVDNAGGNIFFYGGLKDGVMDYWTDQIPQSDGKRLKRHLQFIKLGPDTVRQFTRGSNDDGKTWFVEYDFTYNRKK